MSDKGELLKLWSETSLEELGEYKRKADLHDKLKSHCDQLSDYGGVLTVDWLYEFMGWDK